jgi:hypothetical protein
LHIWTDIVTRELLMLITLLALGSGPASLLGPRFSAASRVAMAPVLGLCVGTCVFTTLLWFTAARNTYWLLPVLALVSVAIALWRGLASIATDHDGKLSPARRLFLFARRLRPFDAVALIAVCVIVAAPLSYTLHERHSVGPTGRSIWDADDYTAEADAMQQLSIRQAHQRQPSGASFTRLVWSSYSQGNQNLDAAPLSANVDGLLGLGATNTQSLFLIVFLVSGALGAFAAVRYLAPKPKWVAALAGVLFAGPFFLQLMADGSQAATCGLTVILPIAAVGLDVLRRPRIASLVLLALLASGLMALYPLFVPGVVIAAVIVLLFAGAKAWERGQLTRPVLARAAAGIGGVLALSIVFNLVSFARDASYWRGVLNGTYNIAGLPEYHLPYSVLPGWLLQTREFYSLTELGSTTPEQLLLGVILPVVFIAVIVHGIKRRRAGFVLLPLALLFALMAEYENAAHHCSYCTDRTLLPIAPLSIALFALGVAALATAPARRLRWAGIAMAVLAVIAVGARTRQERLNVADTAYFLDGGNGALLSRLPAHAGPVDLEGYGENQVVAPGELPLVYLLASERNHEEVSVPSEYNDYNALAYFGGANPANPQFDPNYRYVLTRLAGVETGRRVIARTGPLALEERTSPLDVTVTSGIDNAFIRLDPQGIPWVVGPLHLLLVGGGSAPAWISLRFQTLVPVTVSRRAGVRTHVAAGVLTACVRARGTAPVRRGTLVLNAPLLPGIVPAEPFALSEPLQGIQLVAMRAVTHCSVGSAS